MDALSAFIPLFFILSLGAGTVTTVVVWIKRRSFPVLYSLLIVTVFIFLCFFILLTIPIPHGGPPVQVEEAFVADLDIQTTVNLPLIKDQSTPVYVSISQLGQFPSSSGSTPQPTVGLTPVGTPGVPIVKAFGPGYNVSAIAQLSASAFDVAPQEQPEQSLGQPYSVTFTWTVT